MEANLVEATEVGGVVTEDVWKIVAVERSEPAVGELLGHIPGLKVLNEPVNALLHGEGLTTWPTGEHKALLRALVVNLDLTESLKGAVRAKGDVSFPVIEWIRKIAILHQEGSPIDWTLCLTLNASTDWGDDTSEYAVRTLRGNLQSDDNFRELCVSLIGEDLVGWCMNELPYDQWLMSHDLTQLLLMALVPKLIARSVYGHGWRIEAVLSVRYGGSEGAAPMVSWILRFCWDPSTKTSPEDAYRECVRSAARVAQVAPL
jgi:hypothetical protein